MFALSNSSASVPEYDSDDGEWIQKKSFTPPTQKTSKTKQKTQPSWNDRFSKALGFGDKATTTKKDAGPFTQQNYLDASSFDYAADQGFSESLQVADTSTKGGPVGFQNPSDDNDAVSQNSTQKQFKRISVTPKKKSNISQITSVAKSTLKTPQVTATPTSATSATKKRSFTAIVDDHDNDEEEDLAEQDDGEGYTEPVSTAQQSQKKSRVSFDTSTTQAVSTHKDDLIEESTSSATSHFITSDKILQVAKMTPAFKGKIALVDFETTSFSARIGGRAISLGILLLDNGVETVRWEAVFNPDKDSNVGAFKAHGISRSVTRTMPHFQDVAPEIYGILGQADHIVAHNAKFDWRYMTAEFQRTQLLETLKRRNVERLLDAKSPLSKQTKIFLTEQLDWIKETPHLQDKRLHMFQSRLTTALWLYLYEQEVLIKGDLFDEKAGRFRVPFLPTPKSEGKPPVKGYAQSVNAALLSIYNKMATMTGRTKSERDYIQWGKYESIDISDNPDFTPAEKRRKGLLDKQIRAVGLIKKFTFLEMDWNKIYDWKRVRDLGSVFYNKSDGVLLGQITGFLNLARGLVENNLIKAPTEVPKFLDFEKTWVDSLVLAKSILRRGQDIEGYKLDALCDYFGVDRSRRKLNHGAEIDSELLAHVFAKLHGTELKEVPNSNLSQSTNRTPGQNQHTIINNDDDNGTENNDEVAESLTEDATGQLPASDHGDELIGGLF